MEPQQDKIFWLIQSLAMRLRFSQFLATFLIIGALMLGGCSTDKAASVTSTTSSNPAATSSPSETATKAETKKVSEMTSESNPGMQFPRLEGKATVVMTVKGSPITIEVDGADAPVTAGNFVDLVQKGFYDGLAFHRVVREPQPFVVQGGDPKSKDQKIPMDQLGTGGYIDSKTGSERYIPLEIKVKGDANPIYSKTLDSAGVTKPPVLKHKQGAIAMARSQMPDSASSQFYFALADLAFLDGNYAVFGNVTKGFDVVNKIQQGDRIEKATVTEGAENLKTAHN
jgi:peptidyl-prolyl cis-trans isomerase B (cyclophilin B)